MRQYFLGAVAALLTTATAQAQMPEFRNVATNAQYQIEKIGSRVELVLTNPNTYEYKDAPVCIALPKDCKYRSATIKTWNGTEIPSQMDDLDGDGDMDELAFVYTMAPSGQVRLIIRFDRDERPGRYPERVYAMMGIRDKRKDIPFFDHQHQWCDTISEIEDKHYSDVFPHGPAIENELVGFRYFFNAKQSTDYYGKRIPQLEFEKGWWYTIEIPEVRDANNFGEDVIRVGETVSVGTLRGWNKEKDDPAYADAKPGTIDPCMQMITPFQWRQYRIVSHGPLRTIVDMNVQGWEYQGRKIDVKSRYILYAGQREVEVIQQFEGDTKGLEFVTGAMKVGCLNTDSVELAMVRYVADQAGFCATYGYDWPDGQRRLFPNMRHVGLAVSIPQEYVVETIDRKEQILYGIKTDAQNAIRYRYAVCAPDLETFAPVKDNTWTADRWFKWAQQWNEVKPLQIIAEVK